MSLLSITEAAPLLGLTASGVRKLVDRSRRAASGERVNGPTIRFYQPTKGACIRFKREWIEEFVDRCTVEPKKEKPRCLRGPCLDWSDL
jgi:hypothetical protein